MMISLGLLVWRLIIERLYYDTSGRFEMCKDLFIFVDHRITVKVGKDS